MFIKKFITVSILQYTGQDYIIIIKKVKMYENI